MLKLNASFFNISSEFIHTFIISASEVSNISFNLPKTCTMHTHKVHLQKLLQAKLVPVKNRGKFR